MKNKGFTFIELLVVIAIIGLLASVVLVSMGGIRSKAQITKVFEFSQSVQRNLGAYAVGIWSFDEGSGTTAKDGSGYANDGVINGAVYVSDTPYAAAGRGAGKYALSFDGTNDYISIPDSSILDVTSLITLEAWIKPELTSDAGRIIWKSGAYSLNQEYTNAWRFCLNPETNCLVITKQLAINTWHHIIGVYDTSFLIIYIDGQEIGRKSQSVTINVNNEPLLIGAYPGPLYVFSGLIDEVRIYEMALTIGEIQKLYAEGLKRHKALVIK